MELGRKPAGDGVYFDDVDRAYVVAQLEGALEDPVDITLHVRRGSPLLLPGSSADPAGYDEGRRAQRLLDEVGALAPGVRADVRDSADPTPVFSIAARGRAAIRFVGVPRVNLFRAFLDAIRRVSTRDHGLAPDWTAILSALPGDVHAQVFATPTCPSCPPVVTAMMQMALTGDRLSVEVVDGIGGMDLVREWGVSGVPTVIFNGRFSVEGPMPEDVLLEFVRHAADTAYPAPAISSVPFRSCGRLDVA